MAGGADGFQVVVLSGPSGSGKTTIVERLIQDAPVRLIKSVSATTRPPRRGEVEGDAYYFLSPQEFAARQERGEFLETAEVFGVGYWYGTLKSELERAKALGGWSFLEIDVQGALRIMEQFPEAITIFVEPPSMVVCEQRLRSRGTEAEEVIQRRLRRVTEELQQAGKYRYRVVNDDLERALTDVRAILARHSSASSSPTVANPSN